MNPQKRGALMEARITRIEGAGGSFLTCRQNDGVNKRMQEASPILLRLNMPLQAKAFNLIHNSSYKSTANS